MILSSKIKSLFLGLLFFSFFCSCIEGQEWKPLSSAKRPADQDANPSDQRPESDVGVVSSCDPKCRGDQFCDEKISACVSCLSSEDCGPDLCVGGECVECEQDDDCKELGKAQCENNTCVACATNDHCLHFPDARLCKGGTKCVQCLDSSDCVGGICDMRSQSENQCLTGPQNKGPCEPCSSDSDCVEGHICTVNDESNPGETFCFAKAEIGNDCNPPYTISDIFVSANGVASRVCYTTRTATCPAVLANLYRQDCMQNSDCPGTVGQCSATKICSYPCTAPADCKQSCGADNLCL